jgi:hypothetical protein
MLEKLGMPAPPIEDHGVAMIARCARQHHLDLALLRSLDQAVRERVVRFGVGAQQESTPPGSCHDGFSSPDIASILVDAGRAARAKAHVDAPR